MRLEGRTIVVTDLKSRNGTVVRQPGLPPRRLRQWESIVVTAGAEIDLGGEVVLRIHHQPPHADGDS